MTAASFVLDLGSADTSAITIGLPDGAGGFSFDAVEYDEAEDRLRLTKGPPTAAAAADLSPEGHVIRTAAPDGVICGLTLTEVRRRLVRDGGVQVTLAAGQTVWLGAGDIAHLLTPRRRSRRFSRAA